MADGQHEAPTKTVLSKSNYDLLKKATQYWLPAAGVLYFTLAGIWGLPKAEEVLGSIAAFEIFIGVVLGISNARYQNSDARFDGAFTVNGDTPGIRIDETVEDLVQKNEVVLKVNVDREQLPPM